MSVAKTSEISASSPKSFDEAISKGIKKMSETVKNIEGACIKEQKVVVKDGDVASYRVTMKVTFIVK